MFKFNKLSEPFGYAVVYLLNIYIFVVSVIQFAAITEFLTDSWDWHWLIAGPVAMLLAAIPWLSTLLGIMAASEEWWRWDLWQIVLLMAGPNLMVITLYGLAGISSLFASSNKQQATYTTRTSNTTTPTANTTSTPPHTTTATTPSRHNAVITKSQWNNIIEEGLTIANSTKEMYDSYCELNTQTIKLTEQAILGYYARDIVAVKTLKKHTIILLNKYDELELFGATAQEFQQKINTMIDKAVRTQQEVPRIATVINTTLEKFIQAISTIPEHRGQLKQVYQDTLNQIKTLESLTPLSLQTNSDKQH